MTKLEMRLTAMAEDHAAGRRLHRDSDDDAELLREAARELRRQRKTLAATRAAVEALRTWRPEANIRRRLLAILD